MKTKNWYDQDDLNHNEGGIMKHINSIAVHDGALNEKDFEDWWNKATEQHEEFLKKKKETIAYNIAHLNKRSKELEKPIPTQLLYMVLSTYPLMVGTQFVEQYKEWFND